MSNGHFSIHILYFNTTFKKILQFEEFALSLKMKHMLKRNSLIARRKILNIFMGSLFTEEIIEMELWGRTSVSEPQFP